MNVRIVDFQSLKDVTLDVTGLTVLVGPSNRGKSALIRALSGALFNRAGDGFVRKGAKFARVELQGVPARHGPPLDVTWEKGTGGVNRFTVNGQDYSSVGRTAPLPLAEAGYRDLTLDQRDALRPQIGGQFQGPFLLDASGSVVSEVLTRASRLDILLRAGAACTRDLRATRQLAGVRRADLTKATAVLATIGPPVRGQQARVETLEAAYAAARQMSEHRDRLQGLVEQRQRWQAAVLPGFRGLGPVPRADFVIRAVGKADKLARLRWLQGQRTRLLAVPSLGPRTAGVGEPVAVHAKLSAWAPQYLKLLPVRGLTVAPAAKTLDLDTPTRIVLGLRKLSGQFVVHLAAVRVATGALSASEQEVELAEATLQATLSELGVCPACGKPA